jgi:sulfur carrier protein ThiS
MKNLTQIVREEVEKYAGSGRGARLRLFPILDDVRQTYVVTAIDYPIVEEPAAGVVVLARIVGDQVVIEEDMTDKPLIDALLQRGIPRSQIVLAYDGEPLPDAAYWDV